MHIKKNHQIRMNYQNIIVETEGKLATVTINRPQSLNALNSQTIQELSDAFSELDAEVGS